MRLLVAAILALLALARAQQEPPTHPVCEADAESGACEIPDCLCPSSNIPDGWGVDEIPQFVVVSFDDGVNNLNFVNYTNVLFGRTNPNQCSIGATFYITHDFSNYTLVHDLWRQGYEIASHSMTHRVPVTDWQDMLEAEVLQEMDDVRLTISTFANIPIEGIIGARAPFLQMSGDEYMRALSNSGFQYDASRPTRDHMFDGLWPYSMDYNYNADGEDWLDCPIAPCWQDTYPDIFEMPIVDLNDTGGIECSMLDMCDNRPENYDQAIELLRNNFYRAYDGPRYPFGLYTHSSWWDSSEWAHNLDAYRDFLDEIQLLPEVYIVSNQMLLQWVKNPYPLELMPEYPDWRCVTTPDPADCVAQDCEYPETPAGTERFMGSCVACPVAFPWVGDPLGEGAGKH